MSRTTGWLYIQLVDPVAANDLLLGSRRLHAWQPTP
jgi:hypothetical protein